MTNVFQQQDDGYEAIEDPFQTLPDGLDDPYRLFLAFSHLVPSANPSHSGRRRARCDEKNGGAVSRARAAGSRALAALMNPIAMAARWNAKK
jgi:hypothetical protein